MLTPKQEAFCVAYLETGNASEAYRRAYDAGAMKPATVNRTAKEVVDNPKIAARLAELRQPAVDAVQITLQTHLQALQALRDKAATAKQYAAAITAETNRGKAAGLYTEKIEANITHKTLAQELADLNDASTAKDPQVA